MTVVPTVADLERALLRVVVGYRLVAWAWMALLAAVVVLGERVPASAAAAVVGLGAAWTVASVGLVRRPGRAATVAWLVCDVVVSVTIVLLPAAWGHDATFFGGYPFSTIVLAAWARGYAGGLPAAVALAAAAITRAALASGGTVALPGALDTAVFHLVGGAVLAWGITQLRRGDAERRAAEAALAGERAERSLAQERAETSAHLHDSVLQTLALIQRRSGDPAQVTALARAQERDLRDWLIRGRATSARPGSFAAAITAMGAEVEALHHVTVDVVTAGDTELDDDLSAAVAAAREAVVNAAKHAGADRVAVFAEAAADGCAVYVRDRGVGFDPEAFPRDRRGLAESVLARVERHGGAASISSQPGRGTEVRISMPRHDGAAPAVPSSSDG